MESKRKSDELPEVFELIRLRDACRRFITDNKISKLGDIWDVVCVDKRESMCFIEEVCDIIGYYGEKR